MKTFRKNLGKLAMFAMAAGLFLSHGKAVQAMETGKARFDMPVHTKVEAGYVRLVWGRDTSEKAQENFFYELQQSSFPDFRDAVDVYEGPDKASFLSGLKEGIHYFRVRGREGTKATDGAWSRPILVEVKYQSMALAWTLLATGAVVFLSTVMVILFGSAQNKKHQEE